MKIYATLNNSVVVALMIGASLDTLPVPAWPQGDEPVDVTDRDPRPVIGAMYVRGNDTFTDPAPAEAAPPYRVITVPAFLRRFDSCCVSPKQMALAADAHPLCRGLLALAQTRVNEGIDLDSESLSQMLAALVSVSKLTEDEATTIRTTPVEAPEVFVR